MDVTIRPQKAYIANAKRLQYFKINETELTIHVSQATEQQKDKYFFKTRLNARIYLLSF